MPCRNGMVLGSVFVDHQDHAFVYVDDVLYLMTSTAGPGAGSVR